MMATTPKPVRRRGRPKQFEPDLKVRFTEEQFAFLQATAAGGPLSEVVRECVQARMDGAA